MKEQTIKQPLVSIIIPVHNGEKYIEQCVRSALNQTYKSIEIIVVDDGSSDGTEPIVKNIVADNFVVKFYKKDNGGVSSARNYGINKSRGEYIFFIDADDYINDDCIEYCMSLICTANADCAVVPRPNKFISGESDNTEKDHDKLPITIVSGREAAERMLYYQIVISSWGKMFSRQIIKKNNISFDEGLSYGEGFLFSISYFMRSKKVALGQKRVYNYRLDNQNSVMTNYKTLLVLDSLKAQEKIRKVVVRDGNTRRMHDAIEYAGWHTECDCLNTMIGSRTQKDKDIRKMLIRGIRKKAICNLGKPISKKEKIKSVLYWISPAMAARLINSCRKRVFTKD